MKTSVVVCTHDPPPQQLGRVLAALQSQTLPMAHWELLIIDNASKRKLADELDLSWHPRARVIREDELGLTPARLRGIREATGDVIIFVDDDNLVDGGYLAESAEIASSYPFLGAWGGCIDVDFETPPPPWVLRYRSHFAFRSFKSIRWSNIVSDLESQPYGAGMCLRRSVCLRYADVVANDTFRRSLDRRGKSLLAGGDLDLVISGADLGLGWGNFPQLKLKHLIPARRFQKPYMLELRKNVTASNTVVALLHGFYAPPISSWRFWIRWLAILIKRGRHDADFARAEREGTALGVSLWQSANQLR